MAVPRHGHVDVHQRAGGSHHVPGPDEPDGHRHIGHETAGAAGHGHDHEHGHGHGHGTILGRLRHLLTPHSHDPGGQVDAAMETNDRGMRALWLSLVGLGATAAVQAVVFAFSGSVALLGDTLHNVADALTAVPLGIAFTVGRRAATRRYTYGFGRAEDLAGVAIVLVVAGSSAAAAYTSVRRLFAPTVPTALWAVALAGLVGFAGNEAVARYRIRVGREIGSAALVADGLHARTDGFTSLAVVAGAIGVAAGAPLADPAVGLFITVAILAVVRDAAREVYRRLMDAVDPELVDRAEATLRATGGVLDVGEVRIRWIGHRLRAECTVVVDAELTVVQAHDIAVDAEHALLHELPRLSAALVHADPCPDGVVDHHAATRHHHPPPDETPTPVDEPPTPGG